VRYLYHEPGERVAKLFFRQGRGVELTHYVAPGYEVVERLDDAASPTATLTVLEGSRRLASLRFGPPLPGDSLPAVCFTLADHLGSAALTLDANGELLVREEYTPFGETSFGSYARKRYRFGSHERDGESGLYYQGLRYYAPWVARWISADPAGMVDGVHLYRYVRNNPLKLVDPSGLGGEKPKGAIDSWPPMCRVDEDSRPKANPPPETEKQQQTQNPGPIDGVEMMRIANQPTIGAASPYLTSYNPVNVQYKLITSNIDAVRSSGMAGMAALVILATAPDMDPVKANGIIKLAGLAEGTLMQGAGDYARSRKGYEGIEYQVRLPGDQRHGRIGSERHQSHGQHHGLQDLEPGEKRDFPAPCGECLGKYRNGQRRGTQVAGRGSGRCLPRLHAGDHGAAPRFCGRRDPCHRGHQRKNLCPFQWHDDRHHRGRSDVSWRFGRYPAVHAHFYGQWHLHRLPAQLFGPQVRQIASIPISHRSGSQSYDRHRHL
jgi:RHS repeat-associated protein